jgi:hypothetical protein
MLAVAFVPVGRRCVCTLFYFGWAAVRVGNAAYTNLHCMVVLQSDRLFEILLFSEVLSYRVDY